MTAQRQSRERDEIDLAILSAFTSGETTTSIARRLGLGRGRVVAAISRVRDDDVRLSGEPRGLVRLAYVRPGA